MANRYRQDMQRAWRRIAAIPTRKLESRLGTVQYAQRGAGLPVVVCTACSAAMPMGSTAGGPGCWGRGSGSSPLPVRLLRLDPAAARLAGRPGRGLRAAAGSSGVDRAAVLAYSAGSASALELALRHPNRVVGLVLANARLGGPTPSRLLQPIQGTVYGWERLWWLYRALLPSIYGRMVGVPEGYQPTPEDGQVIRAVSELQFPLRPRKQGAIFDGFVSNLVADRFGFEDLTVPTLLVSATDDPWARHQYPVTVAARVPGARLMRIDRGGHLFLSHDPQVRTAIGGFIDSAAQHEGQST